VAEAQRRALHLLAQPVLSQGERRGEEQLPLVIEPFKGRESPV
jgi:hypothetical protein